MSDARVPSPAFWEGRRVLVTGHTGFKGSWLTAWLAEMGASVAGLSLPGTPTTPSLWKRLELAPAHDIRADVNSQAWQDDVVGFDPQIVIHLAAQSLVAEGYANPYRTFETNVLGTANLLTSTPRFDSLEAVLVATTDKVYDTRSRGPYPEDAPLGGTDPYAASKAGAELVVRSWPSGPVPIVTARAGNVIGGGDWGSHRLLPDLIRAWSTRSPAVVRRPTAVRPWQHVLEPLSGYLVYLEQLSADPGIPRALNFGPAGQQSVAVREVVDHAASEWRRALGAEASAEIVVGPAPTMAETELLEIDSSLAHATLGWRSVLDWREAISLTVEWYAADLGGKDSSALLQEQLRAFAGLAVG